MLFRNACLVVAFCFIGLCSAAESICIATVVDGDAFFVRDTMKYALKPGTHLGDQDLIETGPKTAIVRLEFTSGMMINLGPTTRVILSPKLGDGSLLLQPALYAINGWIKICQRLDGGQIKSS